MKFYTFAIVILLLTSFANLTASRRRASALPVQLDTREQCAMFNHATKEGSDHYKLRMNGYEENVPVTRAVEDFNRYALCHQQGKTQPPLTVDEFLAAVRDANPAEERIQPWVSKLYRQIAETQFLPKGSFIDYGLGAVNDRGYDISLWSIDLYVGLDRYTREKRVILSSGGQSGDSIFRRLLLNTRRGPNILRGQS